MRPRIGSNLRMDIFRKRRWRKLRQEPWPEVWRPLASRRAPLYGLLPDALRAQLEGLVQIFLAEKSFEGCGGLVIGDEIRLAIASQACLLQLRPDADLYPRLDTVLVYPGAFVTEHSYEDEGLVTEITEEYLGESWDSGALVLSWADIVRDAENLGEGYNVVLHEFAHQLDEENHDADGTPLLPDAALAADWARVCGAAYAELCAEIERDIEPYFDPYAAEHPAEFFAVLTEEFFAGPHDLRTNKPDLYDVFSRFYHLDPANWAGPENR